MREDLQLAALGAVDGLTVKGFLEALRQPVGHFVGVQIRQLPWHPVGKVIGGEVALVVTLAQHSGVGLALHSQMMDASDQGNPGQPEMEDDLKGDKRDRSILICPAGDVPRKFVRVCHVDEPRIFTELNQVCRLMAQVKRHLRLVEERGILLCHQAINEPSLLGNARTSC